MVNKDFQFLASFMQFMQVSMSSSNRCDAVCLLSWTHTLLKCKLGTLPVLLPLNSGKREVLQGLHGLLRTWICAPVLFWTTKRYILVSPDETLSKAQ